MSEQIKIAFESWYDNDISEPLPDDYTILGKRYLYMGWKAATTESNKRIDALEGEVAEWKERVANYDRWLSGGVYYTNDEAFKLHDNYNNKIAELQASNNHLREAINEAISTYNLPVTARLTEALAATSAESLKEVK